MISFLKGKIQKLGPFELHLDVSGVGYKTHITLADSEKLRLYHPDEPVFIYTRVQYTESAQNLYGFLDEQVAELYDFLINLHGIGPKIVMSILSYCNTVDFIAALENGTAEFLTRVPGIGKSKADKIIFEAKSRQKKLELIKAHLNQSALKNTPQGFAFENAKEIPGLKNDLFTDILTQSLESLGFTIKEITLAEKKIAAHEKDAPEMNMDNIQQWIRIYLRYL